jgi:NAD(P)-dependent dehydrogenase (short-subunit alcohol dehydrogenase family)
MSVAGLVPNKIFESFTAGLPALSGKCFALTGSTSGTGYYTCEAAIKKDAACLILLNRDSHRSDQSFINLKEFAEHSKTSKGTILKKVNCDLQSFASVVKAAAEVAEISRRYGGLDGLINNAGVMAVPDSRTIDGYDVQMQTNHLSHFLLVRLLIPSLEAASQSRGESRIVQHSSGARAGAIAGRGSSGMLEAKYMQVSSDGSLGGNGMGACFSRYHQTKLANSVFMMALHHKLVSKCSKIKSLCAEPGVAQTQLVLNTTQGHAEVGKDMSDFAAGSAASFPGMQSAADGACPLMAAAFGADVHSGDFFMPGDLVQKTVVGLPVKCITAGKPTPSSKYIEKSFDNEKLTLDDANQQLLWEMSEQETQKWVMFKRGFTTKWKSNL